MIGDASVVGSDVEACRKKVRFSRELQSSLRRC